MVFKRYHSGMCFVTESKCVSKIFIPAHTQAGINAQIGSVVTAEDHDNERLLQQDLLMKKIPAGSLIGKPYGQREAILDISFCQSIIACTHQIIGTPDRQVAKRVRFVL